jgi:hypothetical protein
MGPWSHCREVDIARWYKPHSIKLATDLRSNLGRAGWEEMAMIVRIERTCPEQ